LFLEYNRAMSFGPWTRNEVLDLHILILLIIWMSLDRCNIYVADIIDILRRRFSKDRNSRFYENQTGRKLL
jgi:hypothetical protein